VSLVSVRTVLFPTRQGIRFRHYFLLVSLRIAKTVSNMSAQHVVGTIYLSNRFCRCKKVVWDATRVLIYCAACENWWPIIFDSLLKFHKLIMWSAFKLWWFPERSRRSTNKNIYIVPWPTHSNHFCVIPNDCPRESGVLNRWTF